MSIFCLRFDAPPTRTCAFAVLAFATLACHDGTAPAPHTNPPTYDLVFDGVEPSGRRVLFHAALDGSTPTLVGGGIDGMRPSPSRDGRRLAFHTIETYEAPSRLHVITKPEPTPSWIEATGTSERELTWSPDGRRVAFVSKRDDIAGDIFVGELDGRHIVNLQNLTPRIHTSPEIEPQYTPAWSPDGTRIAFTSYRSGGPAIWVMNTDGSNARAITEAGDHIDALPSWSPDGTRIAFQRAGPGRVRIGVLSVSDGALRFLPVDTDVAAPAWAPDGERIAATAMVSGERDVVVLTLDGQIISRVYRPGADYNPAWVPRTAP